MKLFSSTSVVGIEVNGNAIRMAVLRRSRKKFRLEGVIRVEAPSDHPEAVRQVLASSVRDHGLSGMIAGMVLHDARIHHRAFPLPKMTQKEIDAVVPFETGKIFDVRPDVRIVYRVNTHYRQEGILKIEVIAAAVPVDTVLNAVSLMENAGLVPHYLLTVPFVQPIAPSAGLILGTEKTAARLHVTRSGVDLTVTRGKHFLFSRMIRKEIDFTQFEGGGAADGPSPPREDGAAMEITPVAEETAGEGDDPFERLCTEINRSFLYVKQQYKKSIEKIWLTGEGGRFSRLAEALERHLKLPLTVLDELPGMTGPPSRTRTPREMSEYDLAVGVAESPSIFSTANLLPRDLQLRWKKRSAQRAAKIAYAMAAVLILFLYVRISWEVHDDQRELRGLQQGYAQVDERFQGVCRMLQAQTDRLLRRAICRGLAPASIPPEDVLAALSLYTPDSVVLDQLVVQGGRNPFSMKLSGWMVLPDYSGAESVLDDFLDRCKGSGLFRTVRGQLGSGADQGESGRVRIASAGRRKIRIEIVGE